MHVLALQLAGLYQCVLCEWLLIVLSLLWVTCSLATSAVPPRALRHPLSACIRSLPEGLPVREHLIAIWWGRVVEDVGLGHAPTRQPPTLGSVDRSHVVCLIAAWETWLSRIGFGSYGLAWPCGCVQRINLVSDWVIEAHKLKSSVP